MGRIGCGMLVLGFLMAARVGAEEPKGQFSVHDLSLWVLDQTPVANSRTTYRGAFPAATYSTRAVPPGVPAPRVTPIGMITFYGRPAVNLDVDLHVKAGTFLGHWPAIEGQAANRLRWSGSPSVELVETIEDESQFTFTDAAHWFHKARGGNALYVRRGARAERFLAYDAEINLTSPIRIEGGPDTYTVVNTSGGPLYDVLISRATPQGRRVGWIDVLPKREADKGNPQPDLFGDAGPKGGETAAPKIASKETPVPATKEEVQKQARSLDFRSPPSAAASGAPKATVKPKSPGGVEVTLSDPLGAGSPDEAEKTTKALAERLTNTGLTPLEVELFAANYAPSLFAGEAFIVACRLNPAAIEEAVPLSIFPVPEKILRVPFLIVRHADPLVNGEVDQLVAQLGDPKYSVRETAQKRLIELGPLAFSALQKATNHADVEVAIRSERILLSHNQTPSGQVQAPPGAAGIVVPAPVVRAK